MEKSAYAKRLQEKIENLSAEINKGNSLIAQKQQEIANLQASVLRIDGALTGFKEELEFIEKEEPETKEKKK